MREFEPAIGEKPDPHPEKTLKCDGHKTDTQHEAGACCKDRKGGIQLDTPRLFSGT
jgi:hypothetical protein